MTKIQSVDMTNWMAFRGRQVLADLPTGAIAVVARYADNPRRSNWAGKTAFLEAVEWCLFEVHRKRYEDDLIHFGEVDMKVVLTLSTGMVIERSRIRGKATKVAVIHGDDSWGKAAAEEAIAKALGFDAVDYRATVCFAQGETSAMVEKTSGERRKIVAQWLELDPWLRVAGRARAHAKALTDELGKVRTELKLREAALADYDPEGCARDIAGSKAEIETVRALAAEVEATLNRGAAQEIQRLDKLRLETVNNERRELKIQIQNSALEPGALDAARAARTAAENVANEAETERVDARRLLGGEFDGRCPVTCSDCPVPEEVKGAKGAAQVRVNKALVRVKDAAPVVEAARARLRELEAADKALTRLREQFNAKTAEAKRLNDAIEARELGEPVTDAEIQQLKIERTRLREAEVQARTDLATAQEEVARAEAAEKWVKGAAERAEALEAKLRAANLATRATGPGGIPAAIAESSLAALELRANGILDGTGLAFEFAWDRETKTLVTSCVGCGYAFVGVKDKSCPACSEERGAKRADELEILVADGSGTTEDVKMKSGGAKVLVGSAIRLAAGMMLRDRRGAPCAWAQVDEPFGALDSENRESLARSFAGMLGAVGLEQAFVVSHDGGLLDALPGRIEIVRYADHSTVEVLR